MKFKHLLITILLVFTLLKSFADPIDEATAKRVALNFLKSKTNSITLPNTTSLDLVYKDDFDHITCYYVFNTNNLGFIIISGDDVVLPVLGYSDESNFEINGMPIQVRKWLEGYQKQIVFAVKNRLIQTEEIENKWDQLKNNLNLIQNNTARPMAVAPLVQTRWGQDPYENALCPYDYTYNAQTVTGCPATAMAQIMKYWNYPTNGTGFHSYSHQSYGTLSANFGSTNYQWSSMPNIISSSNNAVATLMYHCGVAVEMNYGVAQTGGSGSYVIISASPTPQQSSEYAFKTYFGYNPSTIQGLIRSNYSDNNWINLLKNELNNGRPIQYAGFGSGGGHTWVCDGYDNNNYFNMNWGWGAGTNNCNGLYLLNALNPGTLGTGGGTGGFNGDQQALIGIQPPSSPVTYNLALYNTVTPSSNPIYYGNAFSISTNIANNGTNTFSGDYCAAVFDAQYNFIDYVQTISNYTLQGGFAYTNNLVFQNTGLFSMLPGNYYVGIFYRPTGGNWTIVSNSGSFTNLIPISVINSNPIRLNSAISITPSTLVQGQSASANLNIINNGTSTFIGQYQLNLYKLDGTFVQTINTVNENNGLPPGYTYGSPYWTFTTTSITATPGTYIMAALYKSSSSTSWSLTGNGNFQNPVRVIVQAAPPQPDQYETNNTSAQSYSLSPNFINNTSVLNTTGSNIHVASDNDFYKINLPSGNNYTITARIHDSYNSGNGNLYTGDVLFSYSTDGTTWSSSYDDIMPNNISLNGGGTIYFHVAPYFAGNTGTYLLDVSTTRTVCPTATITPSGSLNTCSGNSIVLTSNNNLGNQWYNNGTLISGATGSSYTVTTTGVYTVITTTGSCASLASNAVTVNVNPLPTSLITASGSTTFCSGGSVVLNANTGAGLTYQWKKDGVNITGATASSYTTTVTGSYTVVVTNSSNCSSTSIATQVTVNNTPTTPNVTISGSTNICQGNSVTLTSSVSTGNQWYNNGTAISGANASNYVPTTSGTYTVVATTGTCSSSVSNSISVTVNSLPSSVITAAGATTFCSGGSVVLNANTGTGLTYQWKKDGVNISGATASSYTSSVTGSYTVVVTNSSNCSSTSIATQVTVNNTPTTPNVTISGSTNICQGNSVTLTSSVSTGNQWYNNGTAISGANASNYAATTSGTYTVVATTGTCSSSVSNSISLIVNSLPSSVITAAGATTFCSGGSVVLNANTGTGLTYQWKKDGVNISGATASSYTSSVTGSYTVVVTNSSNCNSTSNAITVTVNNTTAPSLVASGSTSFCQGGSVTITSSSSNGNQWYNNGNLITGATGSSYIATATGVYTVITTTGSCISPVSNSITLTSNALPSSVITVAGPTTFCSGGNVVLNANTGTGLTYQWKKDGADIPGANSATYTASVSGSYLVVVTNSSNCSSNSSPVTVTSVLSPSTPSISWNGTQFSTNATSVSYQWFLNGSAIAVATSANYTPTSIGVYKVTVTANGCSNTSDNYTLVVTGIDPTLTLSPYTAQVYPNPAKNDFAIKFGETPNVTLDIQLINNLGVVLKSIKTKNNLTTIKVNELPSGLYFIKIIGGAFNQVKKIEIIK